MKPLELFSCRNNAKDGHVWVSAGICLAGTMNHTRLRKNASVLRGLEILPRAGMLHDIHYLRPVLRQNEIAPALSL